MLLSGGKPPAQEWFMVQTKSKPRVHRQRLQVQRIFRVKVTAFQSRPDTPYFWLQLEGPRENTGKAKVNSFVLLFLTPSSQILSLTPQQSVVPRGLELASCCLACRVWASLPPDLRPQFCSSASFFSLLPHPSLACHFCPLSVLREPLLRVSFCEPSLVRNGPRFSILGSVEGPAFFFFFLWPLQHMSLFSPRHWKASILSVCLNPGRFL